MSKELKPLLRIFYIYFFACLFVSYTGLEILCSAIPEQAKLLFRLSSIVSMIITVVTELIIIGISFVTGWFLIKLTIEDFPLKIYVNALQYVFYIYLCFEVIKFSFLWIFLIDDIKYIDFSVPNFQQEIQKTNYHYYSKFLNYLSIGFSFLLFVVSLYEDRIHLKKIALVTLIFLIVNIIIIFI